jgi:hypothetical protein
VAEFVTHLEGAFCLVDVKSRLLQRLEEIEKAVNKMKVPASFANQFYGLRGLGLPP